MKRFKTAGTLTLALALGGCYGGHRALDGDAGGFRRPAQRSPASRGEAAGPRHWHEPDDLYDQAYLPRPAPFAWKPCDAGGRVLLPRRAADGDERGRRGRREREATSR